jgi:hypothetical protein
MANAEMEQRGRAKWESPARLQARARRRIIRAFAASRVGGWETETAHLCCPRIQRLSNLGRGRVASGSAEAACPAHVSSPVRTGRSRSIPLPALPAKRGGQGGWPGPRHRCSRSELNQRRDALESERPAQPADGFLLVGPQSLQQRPGNRIKPAWRPVTRRKARLLPAPN